MSDYRVTVTFNANKLKKDMDKRVKTLRNSLKKDPKLAYQLASLYAKQTQRFVPYSGPNPKVPAEAHLNNYKVTTQGRIRYSRLDSKHRQIAQFLNESGPSKGSWHVRFSGHAPRNFWGYAVSEMPSEWKKYVKSANIIVRQRAKELKGK